MKRNQLSKFDTRLIRFNKLDELRIVYDFDEPDLVLARDGKFTVKNPEAVQVYMRSGETVFRITKRKALSTHTREYTLSFLMGFVHYGNCNKCYCGCEA